MTPSRWEQFEAIYNAARECAPGERAAYVRDACAGDEDLHREVESLLAQHSLRENPLDRPAWQNINGIQEDEATQTMLASGTLLGPYRVEGPIGKGGMGEVFRAIDTRLGRAVAIKISNARFSARFAREARAISALNHPYVCTLYDVGATPSGTSYLVMELVEGESLATRLKRGKLSIGETLKYGQQIADALAAAHAKEIIHRDLKPHNVMVTRLGTKVLDFGLATIATEDTLTISHAVMGTPAYMAPELFEGKEADARSDIYALGIVLYEMATGNRLRQDEAPQFTELPAQFAHVVERCVAHDPDERWQAATDVARELEWVGKANPPLNVEPINVNPATATKGPSRDPSKTLRAGAARPKHWGIWAGAAVLLLVAGFVAWKFWPTLAHSSLPKIASIAVLPLQNLSGDPSQEFLSEGATDELISTLGQLHIFDKVISRTSVMRYKGAIKSIPEIGKELGVDAILEGSIQRSGGHVRIGARLIDAAMDRELWAKDYDRDGGDVLGLEAEVASAIAQELRAQITPVEQTRLSISRNIAPAAQDQYLLGRYHAQRLNETDLSQAIDAFTKAIQLQPDYAAAYAGLSRTWAERGVWGATEFRASKTPAKDAVRKALEIDPNSPEAHVSLGLLETNYDWEWSAAEKEFKRAIELDPNYLGAHAYYADSLLMALGRFPEAIAESERAVALDPLSSLVRSNYGRILFRARKYQEAIPQYKRAMELDSQNFAVYTRLAELDERLGMYDEALALVQQALTMRGAALVKSADIGRLYARVGRRKEALKILQELTASPPATGGGAAAPIARIYFALGDKDTGFQWLTKAFDQRELVIFAKFDPNYDDVRSDPRFQALVARLKIPDPR